ncbi:MAG: sulfatase-like hydrolase/transferase [Rikenellaceae bacterium]
MKAKLLLATAGALSLFQLSAKDQQRPNVLLIYTDDHRYTGIHALGGEDVKTPVLDELAHSGVIFDNAFLQGAFSGATSMPSRAMLMTGRNLFEIEGAGHNIPKDHTTIGEVLMSSGYHAHHVGKWHQDSKSLSRSYNSGGKVVGMP